MIDRKQPEKMAMYVEQRNFQQINQPVLLHFISLTFWKIWHGKHEGYNVRNY